MSRRTRVVQAGVLGARSQDETGTARVRRAPERYL